MQKAIKEVIDLSWPTLTVLLCIFVVFRITSYITGQNKKIVLHKELTNLLFMTYLLVLFRLVTAQDMGTYSGTNLTPFKEILRYEIGTSGFNRQVIGNILLFIPFGFFVSNYCKLKNVGGITIITLIISFVIESVQHYIGRSFDVDDIILNVFGGILGYLVYIVLNHLPKLLRKEWVLNLISFIIILVVVLYIVKFILL